MPRAKRNAPSTITKLAFAILSAAILLVLAHPLLLTARPAQAPATATPPLPSAQTPDGDLPSFEVASIRPYSADNSSGAPFAIGMGAPDPSHWFARRMTAKLLICAAYGLQQFQVSGGPPWIDSEHFDITAKVDDATAAQLQKLTRMEQNQKMNLMLRSLLVDRFKLQVTREHKDGQVFALVIAKGGPCLTTPGSPASTISVGITCRS
jgi:Protein of unknown function (DUF3738)